MVDHGLGVMKDMEMQALRETAAVGIWDASEACQRYSSIKKSVERAEDNESRTSRIGHGALQAKNSDGIRKDGDAKWAGRRCEWAVTVEERCHG